MRWFEASLPLIQNPFKACDTRYHLGLAHTFLKDDTKAAARFEEVLAHTPTHVLACIELGKLMTRKGDFERAKDLLQQAVLHNNMRSTLPEMFPDGQRGSAHAAYHPDHEEAVQHWVRISLDELGQFDDVVDLVLQLGENDTKWAERLIDEVLRRKPDHAGALEYRRVKTKR